MTSLVGQISEINRYPVKSFAGESVETCTINTYGLYGDRFCAFVDETKEGWDSFITARDIPNMLAYKAKLIDKGVSVTSPNGLTFSWNEELLDEIQRYSKRKISMTNYKAPNPENPGLMSVDLASVLIITDSSLHKLEAMWGKNLDKQRFRANLIVSIDENTFNENDWIGKQISIGDTKLQIESYCERCSIITIDPDTLVRDTSLLKKVNEQMNLCFGLYASVKNPGQIHVGQKVYLSD
ncbi:MOSC domain-containing protein [Paenibacillus sedimenti]|uniref:MOSC domain-containing protein n=1 Tax=Paenibacillus sedimenti TaxID=2770274 RepID=A0A926QKS1_9BACL|nr:MOSC N-terminal beta barrel domain-containing protein [Paenibacillus sedimenti]MBD0382885.1 MOSC domain-containing protein [Paenibacillus sedimenti]